MLADFQCGVLNLKIYVYVYIYVNILIHKLQIAQRDICLVMTASQDSFYLRCEDTNVTTS